MTIYYDGQGAIFRYPIDKVPIRFIPFWSLSELWCFFKSAKGKEYFKNLERTCYDLCSFVLSTSPKEELIQRLQEASCSRNVLHASYGVNPNWVSSAIKCYSTLGDAWKDALKFSAESLGMFWKIHTSQPRPFSSLRAGSTKLQRLRERLVGVKWPLRSTEKTKVVHSLIHISSERSSSHAQCFLRIKNDTGHHRACKRRRSKTKNARPPGVL